VLLNAGRWEGEEIHHQRDGKRVTVASRWALQYDEQGAPMRILTINNDISGKKQAESDRLLLTERLSLATAIARVGVWEWDLATDSLIWDATMFEIYGLAPVVPMPYTRWAAAVWPDDRAAAEASLQLAVATRGHGASEFRIVLPDGTIRMISGVQRVILDDRGNATRVIGVNMDVTERTEAAQTLEQSRNDQMRFKDEFLSHVSHELRSPLTAIKQFTSILLGGIAGDLNPEQRQYQEIVLRNIHQLQSMIDDLLEVTRLETGKLNVELERVLLADEVTHAIETLQGTASAKGLRLFAEFPAGLPGASGDATRVRQILIILLDNAVKFTPRDGSVTVAVRLLEEDPDFLLVEVRDTGCGIDPELAERLFERLYQTSEPAQGSRKGLGLGLFICKELVTRQGGRIWARPGAVGGSVFSFTLPVFSLAETIAPMLKDDKWPLETVALVRVAVIEAGASAAQRPSDEWIHQARAVLHRCLLPDLDILLPGMDHAAGGDGFVIAAFATDKGAAVLTKRLRLQCERHVPLAAGQAFEVTHTMIDAPQPAGQSAADAVASMARRLEESMGTHRALEVAHA
jgi:signal transduction histidine kinase